jgi:hypothetical protein
MQAWERVFASTDCTGPATVEVVYPGAGSGACVAAPSNNSYTSFGNEYNATVRVLVSLAAITSLVVASSSFELVTTNLLCRQMSRAIKRRLSATSTPTMSAHRTQQLVDLSSLWFRRVHRAVHLQRTRLLRHLLMAHQCSRQLLFL